MEKKIKISVLMSVYNTEFVLVKRAIDSVLNQDFQDFELIIIDDGSHNDIQNELFNYACKHENKITYLRHKNCGQSKSINRGILNCQGEFVTIIDADDEYQPNHLRSCLKEMQFADLIASTTKTIVDDDKDYYVPDKYDFNQVIHVDDCVLFATLFGKKEIFTHQKFQEGYAADSYFFENAAQKFIVKKVDLRTYTYYRNSPNSVCSKMKKQNLNTLISPN
jgi:glycosyltransferase involved in cell wall biosynthesis